MNTGLFTSFQARVLALTGLVLAVLVLTTSEASPQDKSHVRLAASGGKIAPDGQQTVVIKMDIAKGWHAYANPVKNDGLVDVQTQVKVSAANKLESVKVAYPLGRTQKTGDEVYSIYEGSFEITATVKRAKGDTSPLEVAVTYSVCNDNSCLPPETVKLQVK